VPELPEVETVRRGLMHLVGDGAVIARFEPLGRRLRVRLPPALPVRLAGQALLGVRRRAKFLLFDTPAGSLLNHLGMTGSWRLAPAGQERLHDQAYLHLADGRRLAYRDPRRFGLFGFVPLAGGHPSLDDLGPEPLGEDFTVDYLRARCRRRRTPIKVLIMDQRAVVGVGNIYAQEALFRARVDPRRPSGGLGAAALTRLHEAIRTVLDEAIAAGGTTISDFRQAGGSVGHFQTALQVYGRGGQPCLRCAAALRAATVGGRGTTWCPRCQR
jgi:formamidopyrimidine-DNA glycosylase